MFFFISRFFDNEDMTPWKTGKGGGWQVGRAVSAKRDTPSPARHSRAFQCRTPASTCSRCRSWYHPSARVACCSFPVRCAPDVCPARPDPPGFSWVRSGRDFREPASTSGNEKFYAVPTTVAYNLIHPPISRIYRDERAFLCRATSVFSRILNFQPCGNFNLSE